MVLVEREKDLNINSQPLEWIVPPVEKVNIKNIDLEGFESSLHLISGGCKKCERKIIFKEAYTKLMELHPSASYQERLDFAKKAISELQEQNPDIHPDVFRSMRRSFAARTGLEITNLRKEIKEADHIETLPSGKEIHYKHHWSCALNHIMESHKDDKRTEKAILINIINTRNQLKSIIDTRLVDKEVKATPSEILKISEAHISQLISQQKYIDINTVLDRSNIEQLLNATDLKSSIFMSPIAFYNRNPYTLESWINSIIERQ